MKRNAKTDKALAQARQAYQDKITGKPATIPTKKGKKRATSKPSAKKDKPSELVQPESESVAMGKFIAVGTRGTAFLLSLPTALEIGERVSPMEKLHLPESFGATSAERSRYVGDLHAKGKACGILWIDAMTWISERGAKYTVYTLRDSLKKGLVRKVKATIARDGAKSKTVTLYVAKSFNPAHKLPHCLACDEVPAGRVETRLVNDNRNEGLVFKVKLAKLAK